mgnify:CR=1 FL=1
MVICTSLGRMTFYITYYDNPGQTASGHNAGKGSVAVRSLTGVCDEEDWLLQPPNPRSENCWHEFDIPCYGRGYARDRGCLVTKRNRLDIWLPNLKSWRKWVKCVKKNAGASETTVDEPRNQHCHERQSSGCDPAAWITQNLSVVQVEVEVFRCCEE